MRLYAALGMGHSEVAAWVETISTAPPPPQQQPRPPPPPPAVDALHRDCIREKFAAAVNCDKSFLEDYAVFLAARSAVSPPERRPRDHVRENASAHPGARAAARRVRDTTKVQSSVLASARAIGWRTPPRKPAREWRVTSRSPERARRPPRPPSFLDAKRAREPSPCRTPSPRPRRTPVDARLALLDEITRPEAPPPPPEAPTPQATAPLDADGGGPSTSAASANTNAALRALLKQKDAQIAALKAQLVGPAPRRPPPVPQTTPPKTPSGNVNLARQSPRKRHGALLGQIRDILHLAHAPRRPAAAAAVEA